MSAREVSPMRQVGEQVGDLWWVPLVAGLLSLGFGLAILATDWTVKALVLTVAALLVVRGLALALHPGYARDGAAEQVVAGGLTVLAGLVLLAWPEPTLLVLATAVGAVLALSGAFHVVSCLARRRHMEQWGLGVGAGVVELLLGVWVMRRPDVTLSLVVTALGLWAVLTGVLYCVLAFEVRQAARALRAGVPTTVDLREAPERSASRDLV